MAFILVKVYVQDLEFSKIPLIQTQITLFNVINLLYNKQENIMFQNIFTQDDQQAIN